MPMRYKVNVLEALKAAGYNTGRIRREHLLAESTVQKLRTGEPISWENLSAICKMLNCQPGDILEFVPDKE